MLTGFFFRDGIMSWANAIHATEIERELTALEKIYKEEEQRPNPEQQSEPKTLYRECLLGTLFSSLVTTTELLSKRQCVLSLLSQKWDSTENEMLRLFDF
jgi:hypothetical protein